MSQPVTSAKRKAGGRGGAGEGGASTDPVIAQLVEEFSVVPGICAIGLGGSRSIGTAVPGSDYDLIIFSQGDDDIDLAAARAVVEKHGGKWPEKMKKPLAEMTIRGHHIELIFRTFERIGAEIANAKKGQLRRTFNPLHTIGFLSTVVVSYATYIKPLWDPEGRLKQLIDSAWPYPEALRTRMLKEFKTEARLALIHASKVRSTNDVAYLLGLYARANAAWQLVLFAANRRYPVIDKGGRQLVAALPEVPDNFDFRVRAMFRAASAGDLRGAIEEGSRLHREIDALAPMPDAPGKTGDEDAEVAGELPG